MHAYLAGLMKTGEYRRINVCMYPYVVLICMYMGLDGTYTIHTE